MNETVQELYDKAEQLSEKYGDQDLYDYLLSLANKLEQLEMMRHHFGYFVMHAKAVCPYDAPAAPFPGGPGARREVPETGVLSAGSACAGGGIRCRRGGVFPEGRRPPNLQGAAR